ncbi:SpvB/TcaC N-terminal domain-containing protein [Kribbella deserti]|uniref:SpvB/TcaC N-terminal domain-containing protein n=1 Tax=Kribbella deserti TaxID=1926257 RepID=A0ABV6QQW2_9ACTN
MSSCLPGVAPKAAGAVSPDREEFVSPAAPKAQTIGFGGAQVVVRPAAVSEPVRIGISALTGTEVPSIPSAMTNVTGRAHRSGFRFTPHPHKFKAPVEVTLPYDPALLEPGFSGADIRTYFFNDVAQCWQALELVTVDQTKHTVTSRTDHFTDMVNATVTVPEHPENTSFNPNQIKGIQAADPGSKVNLIAPPTANNAGDNRLSYPVELPPGRLGVQPQVRLSYSSAASNGWLGVGWDLAVPSVTIDTRWGVPRYDATKETETYLVDGEQVTPVAHRGTPVARTAEKVFHSRVEGGFAKIVRHGSSPKTYSWEITDKSGTRWIYGGAGATLSDDDGNGFLWALRERRDRHDNLVRYHYALVEDAGIDGSTQLGRNLYPRKITYTGQGGTEGRYSVTFIRDRELNEAARVDKIIDARGRFKRVTADRLRRIEVKLDDELIRRYELTYTTGAFHKTLLREVAQQDDKGALFNKHEFSYFDDIRDASGKYQAFQSAQWTVPGDGLTNGKLNLTPDNGGDASALQANRGRDAGGHLYVGAGLSPTKSGSIGVKVGGSHASHDGVLALIDVDGDGLSDKVFRNGGVVKYRKNLSGPNGQARFAETAQTLPLPGIMSESNESMTFGIEGYKSGVAAQLNYVNAFATTDRYFHDVNNDGITDLVNGTSVLFGRLGGNGVPVYGVSADTPVEIKHGTLDTSKLFGDFAQDRNRLTESFPLLDTVRRWVAPFDGKVRIDGAVRLAPETEDERATSKTADGIKVSIQREDSVLWSQAIGPRDNAEYQPEDVAEVTVKRGQRLYFRVQSVFDGSLDAVSWNPRVSYVGVPDRADVNNLPSYRYEASRDFTLGGRSSELKAPLTGTLRLSGDLKKMKPTTDDVTVLVTRDGQPVFQQTLAAGVAGTVPMNTDVVVHKGQTLKLRVKVDSPIDLGVLEWIPRAHYTVAEGVDRVTDQDSKPLIEVLPPFDVDMYPVNGLEQPQTPWIVDTADGAPITVRPKLAFNFEGQKPSGRVTFTVKRAGAEYGELLAKSHFDIVNGVVTAPDPVHPFVWPGDKLYFDFSTTNPKLRLFLSNQTVAVDEAVNPVHSTFHSADEEGAFAQAYRGWAAIGYNGNRDRATKPIIQSDLVIDESYTSDLPDEVDPQAQKDDFGKDPRVTPPRMVMFVPSPQQRRWGVGDHSWVAAGQASSSRMGAPSISLPGTGDLAGAIAVPRVARSEQISLTGSLGGPVGSVGGSIATGKSQGLVDFLDMNGDGFPDVVGSRGIQYTDPTGGLGTTSGLTPDGAVRRSKNIAGNASAGSAARTISTGRGAGSPGRTPADTARAGNDMPPLGVGLALGSNSSDAEFDLLDVNGDGLPDRAYEDGQVALNYGYRFGAPEAWRNPAALTKGSGTNTGLSLGFNTDFYGFAGGGSYHQGVTSAAGTLADMNGDGLADRVFSGSPIKVAFNTGNGFEPAVEFHGSLAGISKDRNATLGGGAYFTFPICFIAACVVINPGVHASTSASRSEQGLRDLNGDGFVDHVASTKDDQLVVAQNRTGRTNLLRGVSRPLGGSMQFNYTRDGNTYDQPGSKFVLSEVSVNDGRPGDGQDVQVTTIEYSGGVYDRLERQFRGYAKVVNRVRDAGANKAVYRSVTDEYRVDSVYTQGLATRSTVTNAAGAKFLETENTYAVRDVGNPTGTADLSSTTATLFPHLVRTDKRFYEGQDTAGKATYSTWAYDEFGNLKRSFDAGDTGTADDLETLVGYAVCPATHILGLPNDNEVRTGTAVRRKRQSTVDCATGDVTQVRSYLADGSAAVTDMTYFGDGNLRTVTGPANKHGQRFRLEYGYDSTVGVHVQSVTDSFGYKSSSTYDFKFGEVTSSTDTNNQVVTNGYDSVGRLIEVTGPYEAPENRATIGFEYHPEAAVPYAVTRHVDREADNTVRTDTIDTIVFVDGLGRKIQTKADAALSTGENTPAADSMVVSGRVFYDFAGRAVKEHFDVTEPKGAANTSYNATVDPVQPTVTSYDILDRVTRTVLPDNTTASMAYGFGPDRAGLTRFETISTDANGKSSRSYHDVRELPTAVKQFNPVGGQPVIWTSFGHNALGERTSITDDHNNVTTMEYDNFGRRTAVASPDSGRTETEYDLADNRIKTITAKLAAQQKAIEYDYEFNRLKRVRYPIFTANNVTYTYGSPGAPNNSAGRITGIVDGAGSVAREYGPLGEVTKETRVVAGQGSHVYNLTTRYQYDTWNRMLKLTYPDGEVLSYHYNSGGEVDSARGVKAGKTYPYLARLEYDKFGQRALVDTGNGTRTRYTYDPVTQRLENLKAKLAQGYEFHNLEYTYDNVGNIKTLKNNTLAPTASVKVGGPASETYQYDDLYRLTKSQGSYRPKAAKTDQYSLVTTYDSIGNTTNKNQLHTITSNGGTQVDAKLTYNDNYAYSSTRPHAAATIGIYTFQYDANGNQVSRNQQSGPRRQLVWDEENRLACSHENVQTQTLPQMPASCDNAGGTTSSRYRYDDQGERVVKDEANFHVYPNQNFSLRGNKEFKHVYIGATRLVTKTVEPVQQVEDQQFYAHSDHLGSTGFVTDSAGALAEHLKYIPGGETWVSEQPSQPVPYEYTGKEFDPQTGFYYHGARYYDPRTSNWQGTDPALPDMAKNSGHLSTYSYAGNNPIRFVDPDGRTPRFPSDTGLSGADAARFWPTGEIIPNAIPTQGQRVLNMIREKGHKPHGYTGGQVFSNAGADPRTGKPSAMLPKQTASGAAITYREWDVNPHVKGVDRGGHRLVTGSIDGKTVHSAYYTADHYDTFREIDIDKNLGPSTVKRAPAVNGFTGRVFAAPTGSSNWFGGALRGAKTAGRVGGVLGVIHGLKGDYKNHQEAKSRGISLDDLYDEQARKNGGKVRHLLPGLTRDRCSYSPGACEIN